MDPERVTMHPKVTQQIRESVQMTANSCFPFWTFSEKPVSRENDPVQWLAL